MSGSDHHAPSEGQQANPVKLAIGVAIGTVALIIAIILLVHLAVGSYGSRPMKGEATMSDKAVASRLAPVAKVAVDPNAPAAPAAPATPPAAPAAAVPAAPAKVADAAAAGKATYNSACTVCHGAGVAGAPKLGDKAAWTPRLAQGKPALHNAALKGKGAMPPKGGNAALSDDAVKAAVDYMLASVK